MKCLLVPALLAATLPVTGLDATVSGGDVVLTWTLPVDPTIAGVRVHRRELDSGNLIVAVLPATAVSYTDTTADPDEDYEYTVYVVDTFGALSAGSSILVFLGGTDCSDGCWTCYSATASGAPPPGALLAAAAAALAFGLRRGLRPAR
jgi:MYXO-CTERM domain-containing protein